MTRFHWQSTFLRGWEEKVDFDFGWIVDRSSPTEGCWCKNLILHSLGWDRPVDGPPKTQVKAKLDVEENARQYRLTKEANVICLGFLVNI